MHPGQNDDNAPYGTFVPVCNDACLYNKSSDKNIVLSLLLVRTHLIALPIEERSGQIAMVRVKRAPRPITRLHVSSIAFHTVR